MIQIKSKGGAFGRNHLHNYFKHFCELCSEPPYPTEWMADPQLRQYITNFYAKVETAAPVWTDHRANIPQVNSANNQQIIIGFSGGKDCVATALLCKAAGLTPILYHLYGINRTYKKEREHARALAKMLGMQYVEHTIEITGTQLYPDHPFKNQLILANMVDYGITRTQLPR